MTVPFEGYARMRAKSLGFPDLPLVVVRHPLADLDAQQIADVAERCHLEVVAALVRKPVDPLQTEREGR